MTEFTTEQVLPITFAVKDGRGRAVAVDGTPVAASSDETVATVALAASEDGGKTWMGTVTSVAPGSGRVTVSADADLGEGVQDVIGVLDIEVTLDPRTGARITEIAAGTPADKAV